MLRSPPAVSDAGLAVQAVTRQAGKSNDILCQNCVRYALQPRSNTVSCGDTLMHTVVAESR